jgi:hypothetical protein
VMHAAPFAAGLSANEHFVHLDWPLCADSDPGQNELCQSATCAAIEMQSRSDSARVDAETEAPTFPLCNSGHREILEVQIPLLLPY